MPIIGATELQPVNILGSYVQGLEAGRANQLAQRRASQEEQLFSQRMATGQAEQRRAELEARFKGNQIIADMASSAVDQPSYEAALRSLASIGMNVSGIPPMFDPKFVAQQKQLALTEAQRIDAELKRRELGVRERTVGVQEKQATTAAAQERRLANAPAKVEPDDRAIVARTETSAAGDVRFYNKYGDLIKKEIGAGKPSGEFEKTRLAREETKRNLTEALTNLKEIVKKGGLIDKSTGSGFGRAVDVTAGFFGSATEGAIAAGQLAPLADQVLKLVPRFEGPQSDKDTQSYREAAGQLADPTLPNEVRKAAANTIIGLFERRKNQFTTQGAPADSGGDWQDL